MDDFRELGAADLEARIAALQERYEHYRGEKLSLNMARGKPCPEQLDLSMNMMNVLQDTDLKTAEGTDVRNYGGMDGIAEAKAFFASMMGVPSNEVIVGGNSSLTMMHDTLARAMLYGVYGSEKPWGKLPAVKFLCPSPGYDRHFAVCELLGIEMVVVDMTSEGPDMNQVEKLVQQDPWVKGIWCVPKYSNPEGITYSDEVVGRLASMKTAAADFRIMWDDAYTVHHLTDQPDELKNMREACQAAGNPDRLFQYCSTSKITFAGSGVAAMATSENNLSLIRKQLSVQTIGPDKMNQLRHVRYFETKDKLREHMRKHAAIIKPKFDLVLSRLDAELGGKHIATWSEPNGGYFISLNTLDGCAKKIVSMAAEAGVTLTSAGATFPYGNDPRDRNIRIAPTFPSLDELKTAMDVLCVCVQLASAEKLLAEQKV